MNVGEMIANIRKNMNITQLELSKMAKLSQPVMNRIESGKRPIRDDELIRIAKALEVSSDYILGIDTFSQTCVCTGQIQLTYSEQTLIKKYRTLDKRGKETVEDIVDMQYKRARGAEKEGIGAG